MANWRSNNPIQLTWAAASALTGLTTGDKVFVTDVGSGVEFVYNGTRLKPLGGVAVIGQSNVATAALTGTTSATAVVTQSILGNLIGLTGTLEFNFGTTRTGAGGNITISSTFGGTSLNGITNSTSSTTTSQFARIANRNSLSSQIGYDDQLAFGNGFAWRVPAINSANNQNLTITATLANAADSLVIEWWTLKLLVP